MEEYRHGRHAPSTARERHRKRHASGWHEIRNGQTALFAELQRDITTGQHGVTHKTGWIPDPTETDAEASSNDGPTGAARDGEGRTEEESAEAYETASTIEILLALVREGRAYAEIEAERQKLRASLLGRSFGAAALLVLVALVLLMGALIALLVGLSWALAPLIGPLPAVLAVFLGSTLLVLLLLIAARQTARSCLRRLFHREGDPA